MKWAGERLDELRRRLAGELRAAGRDDQAATLGTGMWALRKAPEKLNGNQRTALASIAADNNQLYKGYLIKEQLREAFKVKGEDGKKLLRGMIAWAHRCRMPEFIKLAENPQQAPGPHLSHAGRRPLERPGRGAERPGQRPDHPGAGLPQRRSPDGHDRLRARRHMPRFALRVNEQPIPWAWRIPSITLPLPDRPRCGQIHLT